MKAAKAAGLHTCMETCGLAPADKVREIAGVTDVFLFDWKLTDSDLHKKYTNTGNELITSNLKYKYSNRHFLAGGFALKYQITPSGV